MQNGPNIANAASKPAKANREVTAEFMGRRHGARRAEGVHHTQSFGRALTVR
jgi:hypothetical protein